MYKHELTCQQCANQGKRASSLPTDLALSLDESPAARLARFWLPVSGLEALLSAIASTGAAAAAGLVACAGVAGLWAAAGWTGVLAGVPPSAKHMKTKRLATKLGQSRQNCAKPDCC